MDGFTLYGDSAELSKFVIGYQAIVVNGIAAFLDANESYGLNRPEVEGQA
ncbi:MAG TPA: hypothetical protein VL053_04550 [Arachidicoccus sp.]|nr:hypothetical protein [Arachidicoccus sp.]